MKKDFLYRAISVMLLATFACSNEFLNDNIKPDNSLPGDSQLFISPDWERDDYQFTCPNVGDADFTVKSAPKWLEVETTTGKLVKADDPDIFGVRQSVGTIRCKAETNPDFAKMGIYFDNIDISVNGQNYSIPVAYVSEGDPRIEVNDKLTVSYNNYQSYLDIRNTGVGILLWDIVSMPEWLTVDVNNLNPNGAIIASSFSYQLPLKFTNLNLSLENLKGNLVLKTNDKNHPTVTIEVTADMGSPEISLSINNNQIDFGTTSTSHSLDIDAWGSGLLVWSFEELPEWLTITPSSGIYQTHTWYENVVFTCDRTKLQPGLNSAVIYLISNAYNKPSIEITVIARAPGDNTNIRANNIDHFAGEGL